MAARMGRTARLKSGPGAATAATHVIRNPDRQDASHPTRDRPVNPTRARRGPRTGIRPDPSWEAAVDMAKGYHRTGREETPQSKGSFP